MGGTTLESSHHQLKMFFLHKPNILSLLDTSFRFKTISLPCGFKLYNDILLLPMVWAMFLEMPAAFNSSKVKPRPVRFFMLYLRVGHRMMGLKVLTGRGATPLALAALAFLLRTFLAGW